MKGLFRSLLCLCVLIAVCGCEDLVESGDGGSARSLSDLMGTGGQTAQEETATADTAADQQAATRSDGATVAARESTGSNASTAAANVDGTQVPADFSGVTWLHSNVAGWPQTASLSVSVGGGSISLNYSKAKVWPGVSAAGAIVNANPWIFVLRDGAWYAGTFEWLRPGQTSKPVSVVAGDHIKKSPLNNFSPRSGEVYGFMVSGLARTKTRNVRERSNVVMVRWP